MQNKQLEILKKEIFKKQPDVESLKTAFIRLLNEFDNTESYEGLIYDLLKENENVLIMMYGDVKAKSSLRRHDFTKQELASVLSKIAGLMNDIDII